MRRGTQGQTDQGSRLSERSEFERDPGWTEYRRVPVAQRRVADSRGRLLFGYFILAKQNKVTSRRAPPGLVVKAHQNKTTYGFNNYDRNQLPI